MGVSTNCLFPLVVTHFHHDHEDQSSSESCCGVRRLDGRGRSMRCPGDTGRSARGLSGGGRSGSRRSCSGRDRDGSARASPGRGHSGMKSARHRQTLSATAARAARHFASLVGAPRRERRESWRSGDHSDAVVRAVGEAHPKQLTVPYFTAYSRLFEPARKEVPCAPSQPAPSHAPS